MVALKILRRSIYIWTFCGKCIQQFLRYFSADQSVGQTDRQIVFSKARLLVWLMLMPVVAFSPLIYINLNLIFFSFGLLVLHIGLSHYNACVVLFSDTFQTKGFIDYLKRIISQLGHRVNLGWIFPLTCNTTPFGIAVLNIIFHADGEH